ncbi:hypothetical protein OIDMADRAFT_36483 [Oidiodendron maius Zn]|uniref:Zn(2)-C6 fungal-type domain-containing protein n=1 Tax=Oidiodendron maius (strain Zn) TaxID=913774 RepID=A0A0C3CSJ9_OIDMZ|nr:hypothetical protein OIDMADRAFT_36483 [Oidiodendron maius Zn]
MPSKTRLRASIKRTKTYSGCWTCRARGVKCDTTRPACNRCLKSKRACEGYGVRLSWDQEDLSTPNPAKGRLLFLESDRRHPTFSDKELDSAIDSLDSGEIDCPGCQAGPFFAFRLPSSASSDKNETSYNDDSNTSSPIAYDEFAQNLCDEIEIDEVLASTPKELNYATHEDHAHIQQQLLPLLRPFLVSSTAEERRLFHYWVTSASGIMISTGHPDNPYQKIVIPLAMAAAAPSGHIGFNTALLHSIYALTSFNLAQIHHTSEAHLTAMRHQEISLRHLRCSISGDLSGHKTAFLATIIILSATEAISGQFSEWRIHVGAGREWLRSMGHAWIRTEDEVVLYQLFQLLEALGNTHQRRADKYRELELEPLDDSEGIRTSRSVASSVAHQDGTNYLQRLFGVTKPILDIILEINWRSTLACPGTPAELRALAQRMLLINPIALHFSCPTEVSERLARQHACAFYMACNIYYERQILRRASKNLQHLVEQGLYHLEAINILEAEMNVAGLSWPVYVIACEADSHDLRQRSLRLFARRLQQGIGGAANIKTIVIEVWHRRDHGYSEDLESRVTSIDIPEALGIDLLLV